MKLNFVLILAIILILGSLSSTYQKKHSSKRVSRRHMYQNSTQGQKQGQNNQNSPRKSLQSLKTIISQIKQKQPQSANNGKEVNDIKLFLEQQINADSLNQPHEMDHQQQCQFRQGYLTQIVKADVVQGKTIAQGRHVFAVLNKQTISIFEAVHVNALIASLDLADIQEPVVSLKKLNCFKLENKNKKERGFQLCAKNETQMKTWMTDIKNMLTCKVNPPKPKNNESQFETSEEDANDELKVKISNKRIALINEQKQREEQQKQAQQKAAEFQRLQQEMDEQQKKIIEDQMNKAIEELKKKKQLQLKQKRIEEYRRKRQEALNKKAQEDIKCMEKKLEGEEYNARKLVEIQIKDDIAKEIQNDLGKTIAGITKVEKKGLDLLMQDQKELTEEKIQQSIKYQDILVQEVMEYERVLNPNQCSSGENKNGDNIKKICPSFIEPGKPVDLEQLKECLNQDKFCNVCCNYNLGKAKQLEIKECNDKCERVVNPAKYLQNKAKTNVLTDAEKAELLQLNGKGFLITLGKGERNPGWKKQEKKA